MTNFNTILKLRIDWADLDLFGHVNNVAFFKYVQAARVNYCELIGLTSMNDASKHSFMVASSRCQFKKPLLYPGDLSIRTRVDWIKNTSLQLSYQIYDPYDLLVAEAEDILVVFDHYQKTKVTVSETLRQTIENLEGRLFQS